MCLCSWLWWSIACWVGSWVFLVVGLFPLVDYVAEAVGEEGGCGFGGVLEVGFPVGEAYWLFHGFVSLLSSWV